jgi:toxin CcdB
MPQYDVYANPHPASRASAPFVADVQSGLIGALPARLVMPLSRVGARLAHLPRHLCPVVEIDGEPLTLVPHLAAPIDRRLLGRSVSSLAHRSHDVGAALEAVISGA